MYLSSGSPSKYVFSRQDLLSAHCDYDFLKFISSKK